MILVDANILLYAEDKNNPYNARAVSFLDEKLSDSSPVCFCWSIINAFIRISTNPRIYKRPLLMRDATRVVQSWLKQPCARIISPTDNHWQVFQNLLKEGQATAELVPDAHIAALAIQHGCVLYSTDSDFSRFPKLKWNNPLK